MAKDIKRLGKETLVYGTSTVLARLLNFCLVPFYTYYLVPGEYGVIATVFAAIALFNVVFLFGMDQSYLRFASDAADKNKVFRQCFYGVLLNGLILGGLLWLFSGSVAHLIGIPEQTGYLLQLAAVILLLDVLNMIPFTKLRLERRAWYFAGVRTVSIVVNVLGNIYFIAIAHKGIASILWANIFGSLASLLLLSPVVWSELKQNFSLRFDGKLERELLAFAWPFVPSGLASLLVSVIDKPILVHLAGPAQVGIYQANFKIGVFMMLIVSMFDQAWRPFFLAHAKDSDAKDTFARVFSFFVALAGWVLLGLAFLMPDIIQSHLFGSFHLIAPAYWSGLSVIPLVLTGYFCYGLYINFMIGPVLTKKTRVLLWITLLGAAVSITTNLTLVPHIGILGAGWAVALSYAAMAVALFCFTRRVYPIPYEYKKLAALFVLGAVTVVLCKVFGGGLLVKVILLSLYPVFMAIILRRKTPLPTSN
ncbi:lipopolysaccharide biosynthesis protein [Candidatus Avelusimicrobium luingense]|uniref:lipopolysaccharide biosynthesis protein n=1 Tax=Candidatus Avelusimicrobium luingense TaxID=3416211 RepID=UPI003D11A738